MKDDIKGSARSRMAPASFAIELGLPSRALPALSCGCASESQLDRWLSQYELHPFHPSDQQRLVTLLSGLLEELGQWRAPAATRLPMLELLRQYVISCNDAIVTQRSAISGTQLDKLRRSLQPVVGVLQKLFVAYAGLWVQLEDTAGVPFVLRQKRARVLHRAVDACGRLLRVASRFGLAPPERCWRNMQLLLQRGFPQQVAWRRVADPLDSRGRASAIDAYMQAALFFSANPGQLDYEQQDGLWRRTREWCRLATLEETWSAPGQGLMATTAVDRAPLPAGRLAEEELTSGRFSAPRGWKVNLTGILQRLDKHLERNFDPLVERVRSVWGGAVGRGDNRRPERGDCLVTVGLGSTCFNLREGGSGSPGGDVSAWLGAVEERVCLEAESVDYQSGRTLSDYDVSLPNAPSLRSERRVQASGAARHYQTEVAEVFNRSASGLGLKLPSAASERLRVGELVGVRMPDGWQVGVIRWHLSRMDHSRAGVEILARHVVPVEVRRRCSGGRSSAPIPALLTRDGNNNGVALILPVPLFKAYDEVEVVTASVTRSVSLQRQTVATANIARFDFV
ncbi:hypothetical protein [Microbulbifer sediminum]|uniref:hypothetical protein n=1 Tax=Microbulbifer sediminum TaxID=2904250 RepID=UPI001F43A9A7|nr:hypothetical protein [Microbulbifer sediminum]